MSISSSPPKAIDAIETRADYPKHVPKCDWSLPQLAPDFRDWANAMNVNEGEVLAGKFRIERVLGRGGMGVVVAATHVHLGERVALKFLLPEALQNPEAVQRFAREARAAVRIKSEHVARVSDVGTLDNGAPYMVMEYLDGVDLSEWLLQRGALPVEQAVEFVLQACEALAEAHTLGIVHRDLKPANLFVIERPDGALAVKVLDFGISKTTGLGGSAANMTKTSAAMGSPLYMSPEQMQSAKDVDPRGDIWALGVMLYELISARTPFPGETMAELVLKVVTAAPTPLRDVYPPVPAALESVLLKCLEKDRAARYQNVGELATALVDFGPRRSRISVQRISSIMQRAGMSSSGLQLPASSERVDPAVVNASSVNPAPETMASWGQTNPPPDRRRRVILIAAALMAIPIFGVGGVALLRAGSPSAAAAQSAGAPVAATLEKPPAPQVPAVLVEPSAQLAPAVSAAAPSAAAAVVVVAPLPAAPSAAVPVNKLVKASHPAALAAAPVAVALTSAPATAQPPATPVPPRNPLKMHLE